MLANQLRIFSLVFLLCSSVYFRTQIARFHDVDPHKLSLPEPPGLRLVSLGYDQPVADFCWLAYIQYIGDGKERIGDRGALATKFLDLVTYLDPTFTEAFYFAAFIIGGEQMQPLSAARIINRGIEANPDDWRIFYIAGFNEYLYAHDEQRAAEYYLAAASKPGAPPWLTNQALILKANVPTLIKQANILEGMYRSTSDRNLKEVARRKLVSVLEKVIQVSPSEKITKLVKIRLNDLQSVSQSNKQN